MSDLISRQAAFDALEEYADRLQMVNWKENPGVPYKAYALNWCINTIRDLPSAQPERMRGKWERHYCEDGNPDGWRCDNCDEWYYFGQTLPNFCPNCGARMEGEG